VRLAVAVSVGLAVMGAVLWFVGELLPGL